MTTQDFFDRTLPLLVVARFQEFLKSQGSVAITVRGEGSWTIHFGDPTDPIAAGADAAADLALDLTAQAFASFVAGNLDPVAAVRSGDIACTGDLRVLERLGYFLAGGNTALGLRLSR